MKPYSLYIFIWYATKNILLVTKWSSNLWTILPVPGFSHWLDKDLVAHFVPFWSSFGYNRPFILLNLYPSGFGAKEKVALMCLFRSVIHGWVVYAMKWSIHLVGKGGGEGESFVSNELKGQSLLSHVGLLWWQSRPVTVKHPNYFDWLPHIS